MIDGIMYDRVILTGIFALELIDYLGKRWKARNTVAKARSTRRFNRILQSVGLK